MRRVLTEVRRVIVKVGSSLLTAAGSRLDVEYIDGLCAQIAGARRAGHEVVVVSSGAVAAGMTRLGWGVRPVLRAELQVAAAVGQMGLVNAYESAFVKYDWHAAQVLLTAEDMANRTLYLNARATLRRLLEYSVIPLVNENDVIATDSVSFGDNDRLAAQIANLLEADVLMMLTDVPGVYGDDGIVHEAAADDESLLSFVRQGDGSSVGVGGMESKILAARVAARSGAHSLILDGRLDNGILRALGGEERVGTFLLANVPRLSARKRWLASGLPIRGRMVLDAGAVTAVVSGKRSLLAAGVTAVEGEFVRGDSVGFADSAGVVVGYGLVNYDCQAAGLLCGVQSDRILSVLGYVNEEEMCHRDNMIVVQG